MIFDMKKLFLISFLFLSCFLLQSNVYALTESDCTKQDSNLTLYKGTCVPKGTKLGLSEKTPLEVSLNVLKWLLLIAGTVAIIAFVISGIQYLVSAGNDDIIETAKRNMIYSIVGVIIMLSGLIIITAIDTWLRGSNTTF